MVPKWPWFLVEVAVKASGDRATLHLLMFPVFCCYCRLNVCNICRKLATIFLRDNDNATIFEKLATSDNFLASRQCRVVALSQKLSQAPTSAYYTVHRGGDSLKFNNNNKNNNNNNKNVYFIN